MPVTKTAEKDEKASPEPLQKEMHQIIRVINSQGTFISGSEPVEAVSAYVGTWLNRGFKLFNTHYIGQVPEGFIVLYVLVKE